MLRILHCPTLVGGNPAQLARAEREVGLHSTAITFRQDTFAYATDTVWCRPTDSFWRAEMRRFSLLWHALRHYDLIHFNFGRTILPQYTPASSGTAVGYPRWLYTLYGVYAWPLEMRDLPVLKRAGKGIVVTYQGDDARQGDFCRTHFDIHAVEHTEPGYYSAASDAKKRQRITTVAKYADRIYALNPDLLHVLPARAEFLPYGNVDLRDWVPGRSHHLAPQRLTVVHAPTHRGVKGTPYVLRAVQRLQSEDKLDFDFVLVEGLSHAQARRLYQQADLLVDQLLVGWYGGLAVEFMALGKPVICYIREPDLQFLPAAMRQDLPILRATPSTLYDVLKAWLTLYRHTLPSVGQRSRAYVERWHDPLRLADYLKGEYAAVMAAKRLGTS
jgi:hypothetical protein